MNRRTDNERLLAEVLADESGAGFHEALLAETLRHVRRRRQWRRARRIGGALALVVGIGIAVWPRTARRVTPAPEIAGRPAATYQLVVSHPLLHGQLVTTSPGATEQVLSNVMTPGMVHTTSGGYHEVGDDELLALAAPQTVALVRRGPHEAELVFLPPAAAAN
ncbi:MAG: hypothetical protein U1F65_04815 [Verrucomicrobiota bacterium]